MPDYGPLDKLLHRLALSWRTSGRIAFDMDSALAGAPPNVEAPVHIAGLARAGTSILLRALYQSDAFDSLTYRDMPFVLAPNLWGRLSRRHRKEARAHERAHADRLTVDYDTPEAFEEVFWLSFCAEDYVGAEALYPHRTGSETIESYRRYVANLLRAHGAEDRRYLAKNNNNILRLESIARAFPEGRVLIPFRAPDEHALSLLDQQRRFCALHREDPFARRYMAWLGHFEFGLDHKPFRFDNSEPPQGCGLDSADYWLWQWRTVYRHLLGARHRNALFFDYDRLCEQPAETLARLAERIGLESGTLEKSAAMIEAPAPRDEVSQFSEVELTDAQSIHKALREAAI